ncbi:GNAT family N-acetyltransferase [Microbacterium sp. SORGH_AS_0862]|uniref:GNAT family N-acetyltransferase n=1 Tax=Microbacterium sp. SORGH_AS_0862 TaxID=3041789 RepID=UPI00279424E2|nr:GNAT family N-acetyltransferase [Microbacterium sp. SORGH_AS_0862]MDQ1206381.1 putative acetyltransferase [Microbacterium sp. SORGH_AS_0862]
MSAHDLIARQHEGPVDAASAARLASDGLQLVRLADDDDRAFDGWQAAVTRGFLGDEPTEAQRETGRGFRGHRRMIAVLDESVPQPEVPVGTLASWVGELTVPGGVVDSCAISSVTVAPTHRRRGIWRAMMEGELRTAAALGLPVASLTVSESTLYGRFGFAQAVAAASIEIDVKRAAWAGPAPSGRVDFIARERWRELAPDLFDRVRAHSPGEVEMPRGHWDRFAGTRADAEKPGHTRAVQYTAASGEITGLALYSVDENHDDFTRSTVTIAYLTAADADAYAGLWRFFIEMDLIGTVRASELAVDEPLLWMISDRRAATLTLRDHHYLRVLDTPAVLSARRYECAGSVVLDVHDPLDLAGGRFRLTVDEEGAASVIETGDPVDARLGVAELAAIYLGQVSAVTLAAAGRIDAEDPVALARLFGWHLPVRLSYWY